MGHKIVFSDMKRKVGITDVASTLGYSINRKAGVKKYLEYNLGPTENPSDTIIVRQDCNKEQQTFFRRNGEKGDVITLIRENLNSFNVPGDNEWIRTANVLASLANMPYIENKSEPLSKDMESNLSQNFDPARYQTLDIIPENPHWVLKKRGFSQDTINDFKNKITLVRDIKMKNYDGYNIGFPYIDPLKGQLAGYEIRGGVGFKSKAAGTDSANSFWCAEFIRKPDFKVSHIFLFESGFDAMAFYQINKAKIQNTNFSLISFGGAFSQSQIDRVKWKYRDTDAIYFDCFDNDLAGNVYSANLVKYVDGIHVKFDYKGVDEKKEIILSISDKKLTVPADKFNFEKTAEKAGVKYMVQHWKPPLEVKDWNDCLTNPEYSQKLVQSKYQRDLNLAEKRSSGMKL